MQEAPAALVSWIRGLIHETTAASHSHTCSRQALSLRQQYSRQRNANWCHQLGYNIDCYDVVNTMEAVTNKEAERLLYGFKWSCVVLFLMNSSLAI